MSDLLRDLAPGWSIAYEIRFKDAPFVRSWAARLHSHGHSTEEQQPSVAFCFWQEVDYSVFGRGGGRVRLTAALACTPTYRPISYEQVIGAAETRIEFANERFSGRLYDGSMVEGPLEGADFVLGSNMIAQLAIKLRLLDATRPQPYEGAFFSPDTLHAVPMRIEWQDHVALSSFDESLHLDSDGWLERLELPDRAFTTARVARPLPRWRTRLAGVKPSVYRPPQESVCRLVDVQIGGAPPVTIGASLALPPVMVRPQAAALFLGGSGRYDRHGLAGMLDLGYHDLLDHLAQRGVVSLRFDRRGAGGTALGPSILDFGFTEILADARAAAAALSSRAEVQGLPIFLIGHSEGGLVALELAADMATVEGLVLLATAARPIDHILEEQLRTFSAELGRSEEDLARDLDDHRAFFRCVRDVPEWTPETVPPKVYAQRQAKRWYAELTARDPLAMIRQVRSPVLIMQGDRDRQVALRDAEQLCDAAIARGLTATRVVLKGYDHLFKRVRDDQGIRAYFDRRRRIGRQVVTQISHWILAIASQRRR